MIYERADGVVYARYRDRPEIERWIIGGDADKVARANGYMGYDDWKKLFKLADQHPTLRKQLDNTINLYYMLKDNK